MFPAAFAGESLSLKRRCVLFRLLHRLRIFRFPDSGAQARPNVVEQRVELACGFRRANHLLIRRIPQLRLDVQLRAELYGFAINRDTNHNARFTSSVYLILSGIEKNRECAFTHNTSRFVPAGRFL